VNVNTPEVVVVGTVAVVGAAVVVDAGDAEDGADGELLFELPQPTRSADTPRANTVASVLFMGILRDGTIPEPARVLP
jgi:hypothetical protein